jgi:transcriptional repressor NrdR
VRCPYCAEPESKVVDSRDQEGAVRRRRECLACHRRFTTYEKPVNLGFLVVKRDGRREDFDRDKLFEGIRSACHKRPISVDEIERIVGEIESEYIQGGLREVASRDIGEKVMQRLKKLDEIAYVRFASVYRSFEDVETFSEEIEQFKEWRQRAEEAKRQLTLSL